MKTKTKYTLDIVARFNSLVHTLELVAVNIRDQGRPFGDLTEVILSMVEEEAKKARLSARMVHEWRNRLLEVAKLGLRIALDLGMCDDDRAIRVMRASITKAEEAA